MRQEVRSSSVVFTDRHRDTELKMRGPDTGAPHFIFQIKQEPALVMAFKTYSLSLNIRLAPMAKNSSSDS